MTRFQNFLIRISGFFNDAQLEPEYRPLGEASGDYILQINKTPQALRIVTETEENRKSVPSPMKRTKIIIETDRELVVSRRLETYVIWCEGCASVVSMVTVDEAARLVSESSLSIYRLVERGQIHFAETPEGRLFICPHSLS
jgi:hypothetical protein